MALIKENYTNDNGSKEEYWKIVAINFNFLLGYGDIVMGGYPSEETRRLNCEPMSITRIRAKWTDEEFFGYFSPESLKDKSVYDKAYEYIKLNPFFKDAIDG